MTGIFSIICSKMPTNISDILKNVIRKNNSLDISVKSVIKSNGIYVSQHKYINTPYTLDKKICLCEGTLYNLKELMLKYEIILCDYEQQCKSLLHLYNKIGIQKLCQELRGYFAFVIIDNDTVYIARDNTGIYPLYYGLDNEQFCLTIASTPKFLSHCQGVNMITAGVCIKHVKNSEQFVDCICSYPVPENNTDVFDTVRQSLSPYTTYPDVKFCCFIWEENRASIIHHVISEMFGTDSIKTITEKDVDFSDEKIISTIQRVISIIPTENISIVRNAVIFTLVKNHINNDEIIVSGVGKEIATAVAMSFPDNNILFPLVTSKVTDEDCENIMCHKTHIMDIFSNIIEGKIPDEIFDNTRYKNKEEMYYSLVRKKLWGDLQV